MGSGMVVKVYYSNIFCWVFVDLSSVQEVSENCSQKICFKKKFFFEKPKELIL